LACHKLSEHPNCNQRLQCQNEALIFPHFQVGFSVTQEVASSSLVTPAIFFPQKQKCRLGWCHKFAANPVCIKLLPLPKELPPQKKPAD
jgi:hypothetical protein